MGQVRHIDNDVDLHGPDSARVMLQQHLAHICSEAAAVCVTDYEGSPAGEVEALVKRSIHLVRGALEALDLVALLHGEDEQEEGSTDVSIDSGDRASWMPPSDTERVMDTLLLARMGLRSRLRRLSSPGPAEVPLERIALAGGALRTIQKSLNAVDRCLATGGCAPATVDCYHRNVDVSLQIRRQYVELRRMVVGDAAPRPEEVRTRARRAGNAIARLLGLPIAAQMRTGDRVILMMAHSRVQEWLSKQREDDEPHVAEGARLWQDIANLATMFLDVSRREELVSHDARLAGEVLRDLPVSASEWDGPTSGAILDRLAPMRGRSPQLDAMLSSKADVVSLDALRALLVDLRQTLAPTAGIAEDVEPPSGRRLVVR